MKTTVIINLRVEGLHYWPDAGQYDPKVLFLENPHRHEFHITCEKEVTHDDRDIEILLFKREVLDYFRRTKGGTDNILNFGSMSCEMIAKDLVLAYGLVSCTVLEDGENGAKVYAE